ncbi:MAG: hypothetical protein ABIO36_08130 [Pyrinomonadaceae bacterium]
MKKIFDELVFGKNAKVSGLIALAVIGSIALGCNCGKSFDLANLAKESNTTSTSNDSKTFSSDDSVPSDSVVEALVKDTTSQFSDAVESGDFSELHANASTDFQSTYTVPEMKTAFKSYIDKKAVVVPILNKVDAKDAEFSRTPLIRSEKGLQILMATGKFPTKPYNVRFDYEYVMRGGEWKLLKLVINIP